MNIAMKSVSLSLSTTTTTASTTTTATGHRYETCTTESNAQTTMLPYAIAYLLLFASCGI
jgi:hypothetical protein